MPLEVSFDADSVGERVVVTLSDESVMVPAARGQRFITVKR
jgi:hypothetical protein